VLVLLEKKHDVGMLYIFVKYKKRIKIKQLGEFVVITGCYVVQAGRL